MHEHLALCILLTWNSYGTIINPFFDERQGFYWSHFYVTSHQVKHNEYLKVFITLFMDLLGCIECILRARLLTSPPSLQMVSAVSGSKQPNLKSNTAKQVNKNVDARRYFGVVVCLFLITWYYQCFVLITWNSEPLKKSQRTNLKVSDQTWQLLCTSAISHRQSSSGNPAFLMKHQHMPQEARSFLKTDRLLKKPCL